MTQPKVTGATARVLNALVERRPRALDTLQASGAANVSLPTARNACCLLVRLGLVARHEVPSKWDGEGPLCTYAAKPHAQLVNLAPGRPRAGEMQPSHARVLQALESMPAGVKIADVAARVGLDDGTVGTALRALLKGGHVTREQGEPPSGYGQRPWLWSLAASSALEAAC